MTQSYKKYYNLVHKSDGIVAYYPSGFENKSKIKQKKKIFERFYILGRLWKKIIQKLLLRLFQSRLKTKIIYFGINDYFEKNSSNYK